MISEEISNNKYVDCKECTILPNYGNEKIAMRFVEDMASQLLSQQSRIDDVQTVLAEACINAIEYGDHSSPIIVRMRIFTDKFELEVINAVQEQSQLPLLATVPEATAAQLWQKESPRGWGLLFIRQLADQFTYGHCSEGFYVRMTYYVEGGRV